MRTDLTLSNKMETDLIFVFDEIRRQYKSEIKISVLGLCSYPQ